MGQPLSASRFSGLNMSQVMSAAICQNMASNQATFRTAPLPSLSMHGDFMSKAGAEDDGCELLSAYPISPIGGQGAPAGRHPHHADLLSILTLDLEVAPPFKGGSYASVSPAAKPNGKLPPAWLVPSERLPSRGGMSPATPEPQVLLQRQWSCQPRRQGPAMPPLPDTLPGLSPVLYTGSPSGSLRATPSGYTPVNIAALSALAEYRGPLSSCGATAAMPHTLCDPSECSRDPCTLSAEMLLDGVVHRLLGTGTADRGAAMWVDALMHSGGGQQLLHAESGLCGAGSPSGKLPLPCLLGLPTTLPEEIQLHKRIGKGSFGEVFSGRSRVNYSPPCLLFTTLSTVMCPLSPCPLLPPSRPTALTPPCCPPPNRSTLYLLPRCPPPSGTWKSFPAAIKVISDRFNLQSDTIEPGPNEGRGDVLVAECEAALGLSLRHPNIVATYAALTIEQPRGGALHQCTAAPDGRTAWSTYLVMGECHHGLNEGQSTMQHLG